MNGERTVARYRIRYFFLVCFIFPERETTRGNMATEENWEREKSRAKLVGSWLLKRVSLIFCTLSGNKSLDIIDSKFLKETQKLYCQ